MTSVEAKQQAADPITAEVIRNALCAAANQTRLAIIRTAFSPVIYDWQDFTTGLFDAKYRLIGQDDGPPGMLGVLGPAVESMVTRCGGREAMQPGDVLLSTDPYEIGSHAQDVTLVFPAFHAGILIGFAAIKGHVSDLGQKDTMMGVDTVDCWQEGLILPSVRLYSQRERNDAIWRILLANSRLPESLDGDINAFLGGGRVALEALSRIVERHTIATYLSAIERVLDYGETLARSRIEEIPDGRYTSQAVVEAFDPDNPVVFDVVVTVSGSDLVVDYTAAPTQLSGPFNMPYAATLGGVRSSILSALGLCNAANEGVLRPIEVRTTPGTLMHAIAPAPVSLYFHAGDAREAVLRALAQAIPGVIPAGVGASVQVLFAYGQRADGAFWGGAFNMTGGQGGTPRCDGRAPLMQVAAGDMKAASGEVFEAKTPLVIERMELATDSAGAGTYAGCAGIDFEFRAREPLAVTVLIDGTRTPPGRGVNGGLDGRSNSAQIRTPNGVSRVVAKEADILLGQGSVIEVHTGGGGGYGPPENRVTAAVRRDVELGWLSPDEAARRYPHAH
ncbi:hydantoinase B/oxoprolinase family protein [Mycobacterium avium]|uniref:hydantoinase B/oxoprolinase family protein n=1 Tax=Mycobacterium avium TaxID=1764 RepID=UPI001CC7C798|nr:hydantoinase B/oxoprolinase family protein [Mycobacterium avium]